MATRAKHEGKRRRSTDSASSAASRVSHGSSSRDVRPYWQPNGSTDACLECRGTFVGSAARRPHHCRQCGRIVCSECSAHRKVLPDSGYDSPVRVCRRCSGEEPRSTPVTRTPYAPFIKLPIILSSYHLPEKKQWIASVQGFSSQWSTPNWGAAKLIGPPTVYPSYGDHVNAWTPTHASNPTPEWLELCVEEPVRVTGVAIYETLKPGGVTHVQGLEASGSWTTLWQGEPQHATLPAISRIFRPTLSNTSVVTSTLRFTITTLGSDDWIELDAIQVIGEPTSSLPVKPVTRSDTALAELYVSTRPPGTPVPVSDVATGIAPPPCDVTFVLEGGRKQVGGHRAVLWARSKVFRTMLSQSNQDAGACTVTVADFTAKTFQQLLCYVYCSCIDLEDSGDLFGLYFAADKFDFPDLAALMIKRLAGCLTHDNVFAMMDIVDQMGPAAAPLQQPVIQYMKTRMPRSVFRSSAFERLPKHLILRVFQQLVPQEDDSSA